MCAGGGQTPLLPINSIQSSFLSLWSSLGSWNVCLAFPKTGCLLGVNQRDTHRPERPWIYLYVCLHAFLQSVYVCSFVPTWKTKCFLFYVPLIWVAIFVMRKFETISYWLTDQPTTVPFGNWSSHRKCRRHLLSNSICVCVCVSFHRGLE